MNYPFPMWLELLLSAGLLLGGLFLFVGSLALARLPDFYTRLHGPTKATTLGIGLILIVSMVASSFQTGALSFHELMITVFLFITAPITAHMLAKAGLHLELPCLDRTSNPALRKCAAKRSAPDSPAANHAEP